MISKNEKSYTKILIKNNIRIFLSDYTKVANEILLKKQTSFISKVILSSAIATFGSLGFILTKDGEVKISYVSKQLGSVIDVIGTFDGKLRAKMLNNQIQDEDNFSEDFLSKSIDLSNIYLTPYIGEDAKLIVNVKDKISNYNSQVDVFKADMISDLNYFFYQSFQIHSAIKKSIKFDEKNNLTKATSIIMQLLPNHKEEDIIFIEKFWKENNFNDMSIEEVENKLEANLLETKEVTFVFECSYEKVVNMLSSLSKENKKYLFENKDENIEVNCPFCESKYLIEKKIIEK
ncbi:Hsp33 family molecular chaperone HslO [Mycoplasmopsis pulmonis]|uniref:Hsp33 family molecular chaperone HslO n=1 Tax=Mycoplasmopsis pulmonis TaxID=2107 RepID=UPI001004F278|nr:Hsp33 family molecular chaperone HslO [Mycoplasmopsis pulmonis]VEU68070.1 Heat shock protein 33 homolog [Mycoplasmopsis pulmonis]